MIPISLEELVSGLNGRTADQRAVGIPEAQALELKARLARFVETNHTFVRGDFVQHKEGLESLPETRTSHVYMFWRYLDMSHPVDRQNAEHSISKLPGDMFDCILAHVTAPERICFHVAHSQTLEPRLIDTSAFEVATELPAFLRGAPEDPIPA